jgi:hypothetical protein
MSFALADTSNSYFEQAIRHGRATNRLPLDAVAQYSRDAPKGIVQLADYFGSAYLRENLEKAAKYLVFAASLGLEYRAKSNFDEALSLIGYETILSHSKQGFDLFRELARIERVTAKNLPEYLLARVQNPTSLAAFQAEKDQLIAVSAFLRSLR